MGAELANKNELGYLLQPALGVEADTGQPIAPVSQSVTAADGRHTTTSEAVESAQAMTDAVTTAMETVESLDLGKKPVHVADREADSVWHYRLWDDQGWLFLTWADNERLVQHDGVERL